MRNTRRPVVLKQATCTITDSASATNTPPTMRTSSSSLARMPISASAAPRACDPTSPMNTPAGCALNQRKPSAAPATAAHRMPIVPAPACPARIARATAAIAVLPAARPSRPSVRFTALTMPTISAAQNTGYAQPRSTDRRVPGIARPVSAWRTQAT